MTNNHYILIAAGVGALVGFFILSGSGQRMNATYGAPIRSIYNAGVNIGAPTQAA